MLNIFLTLSCHNLRRNKLVKIASKLSSLGLSHKDIDNLNNFERCNVLNSNSVLLAHHFQYHIRSFIWILNGTTLSDKSLDDCVDFLHSVVCGNLPSEGKTDIYIIWLRHFKCAC